MTGRSLLIIEDEPGYQELYRFVLSECELTICTSVEEALTKVSQKSFDLIVLDINLLGLSGLEFLKAMRPNGVAENIPIIVCSGQVDTATRQGAMDGGAAGFIAKPFEPETLRQMAQVLLETDSRTRGPR